MMPRGGVLPLALLIPLAGCIGAVEEVQTASVPEAPLDDAMALVDEILYGEFHTTEEVAEKLQGWQEADPELVKVRSIGKSIEGRDIWAASITIGEGEKPVALIDGGHHASEVEGIEMVLYTGDFLLGNLDNATVRGILETTEVVLVPVLNVDGHSASPRTRGNALGVNLNRNYDVDWGNPLGANNAVMGTVAHRTGQPMPSFTIVAENAGDAPFSEPETQAMRDLMDAHGPRLAFYLTHHTNAHSIIVPWAAQDPPFRIQQEHEDLFQYELGWFRDNTEYLVGRASWGDFSAGLPYSASGSSMDYAYMMWRVPSYTFEQAFGATALLTPNFVNRIQQEDPGIVYWMKAGLPVLAHLLANAPKLKAWELPTADVELPEGVPPEPPGG